MNVARFAGDTALLRKERRRASKEVAGLTRREVLRYAREIIDAGIARFVAYELVRFHPATMQSITLAEVVRLGRGMTGWAQVDSFGCILAGPAWRSGRIGDDAIHAWARSGEWCWRRAALVSTVPLNSRAGGGAGDTKRTLDVCRLLLADRHDMVVKAMSWALRELSKRDPVSVRAFVRRHRADLPARVIREVRNKLDTGLKNPRG